MPILCFFWIHANPILYVATFYYSHTIWLDISSVHIFHKACLFADLNQKAKSVPKQSFFTIIHKQICTRNWQSDWGKAVLWLCASGFQLVYLGPSRGNFYEVNSPGALHQPQNIFWWRNLATLHKITFREWHPVRAYSNRLPR